MLYVMLWILWTYVMIIVHMCDKYIYIYFFFLCSFVSDVWRSDVMAVGGTTSLYSHPLWSGTNCSGKASEPNLAMPSQEVSQ